MNTNQTYIVHDALFPQNHSTLLIEQIERMRSSSVGETVYSNSSRIGQPANFDFQSRMHLARNRDSN